MHVHRKPRLRWHGKELGWRYDAVWPYRHAYYVSLLKAVNV